MNWSYKGNDVNIKNKYIHYGKILYRGYWGTCLVDMSAYSIHNICNYELANLGIINSPFHRSVIAGLLATPIITVGEYLIINKQLKGHSYRNFHHAFTVKPFLSTLGRELPFPVFLFYITPRISTFINQGFKSGDSFESNQSEQSNQPNRLINFISGYISGCICGYITNPCDRYKTLLQSKTSINLMQGNLTKNLLTGSIHRANYIGLTIAITDLINSYRPLLL